MLHVQGNIPQFLLDVIGNALLGTTGVVVALPIQDLHEVVYQVLAGKILASQIHMQDNFSKDIALISGHNICDPINWYTTIPVVRQEAYRVSTS